MSSDVMIQVRGLGKHYRLAHAAKRAGGYRTLREEIGALPARWLHRWRERNAAQDEFWALRDVSFEVRSGEVLGVIGRNGAGKSTLLKILSRIVAPSCGEADLRGRVGSLLEVGTGFHPELTGRENIYLSGALLGLRRHEVRARFDEIVAFAEVERFVDTPCKHYSSGMYMRLGFAVAAHLDAEILLVDEVLAVGDAEFQRKCLGKMTEIASGGRTVLFVSHNLGAIGSLCSRGVWLERGELKAEGRSAEVIDRYLTDVANGAGGTTLVGATTGPASFLSARVVDPMGAPRVAFSMSEPVCVECVYRVAEAGGYTLSVQLKEFDFTPIVHCTSGDAGFDVPAAAGLHRVAVAVHGLQLYPGRYWLRLALTHTPTGTQHEIDRIAFEIEQDFALCARPLPRQAGLIYRSAEWSARPSQDTTAATGSPS